MDKQLERRYWGYFNLYTDQCLEIAYDKKVKLDFKLGRVIEDDYEYYIERNGERIPFDNYSMDDIVMKKVFPKVLQYIQEYVTLEDLECYEIESFGELQVD